MAPDGRNVPRLRRDFFENCEKFPPEELLSYAGLHIAWGWDGMRIVAADSDETELRRKLKDLGVSPDRVVFSYVDDPDLTLL